jgi:hypothetical protein
MKAKLIKTVTDNYILADTTKEFHGEGYLLGTTTVSDAPKLSKQNCDEIFGVVDVEKLAEENTQDCDTSGCYPADYFIAGFNKAMELNKDKVFTIGQAKEIYEKACDIGYARGDYLSNDSELMNMDFDDVMKELQQPTEIEVEIEVETTLIGQCDCPCHKEGVKMMHSMACCNPKRIEQPKLDSSGSLILKKI